MKIAKWKPEKNEMVFQIWYDQEDAKFFVQSDNYNEIYSRYTWDLQHGRLFRTKREAQAVATKINRAIKQILKGENE